MYVVTGVEPQTRQAGDTDGIDTADQQYSGAGLFSEQFRHAYFAGRSEQLEALFCQQNEK
jgi:hypothetical protein